MNQETNIKVDFITFYKFYVTDYIWADIERGDITDIQLILDDIMSRNTQCNIAYEADKELELDLQNCEIKRGVIE